ncbi:MAG TPA: helix-turn-helix domain-containing protein [Solirubrobacteraceae bacterium]
MPDEARSRILERARVVVAMGGRPTVHDFAAAAGVSRATFYRAFRSRAELLDALNRRPEPDSRDRILRAAVEMVGARGLAALAMDELAERAGVSRATLYRLFPGKPALFTALVEAYSPLEPVIAVVTGREEEPPDIVLPEVGRAVYRSVYVDGENRTGLLRALFFEVSSLAPDAEDTVRTVLVRVVGSLAGYVLSQMSAGRLRSMHPLLALQSFIGPIFFHVMTREPAERVLGVEMDEEQAIAELVQVWLRAMSIEEEEV